MQTGVDVYVTFNKPINFVNASQFTIESFANSFIFEINGNTVSYQIRDMTKINDPNQKYLRYFIPLNGSLTNATVVARTTKPDLIYNQDGSVNRQLASSSVTGQMNRYVEAAPDTRRSISQLSDFFYFFTWFALITMIVAVGLGTGVVFE